VFCSFVKAIIERIIKEHNTENIKDYQYRCQKKQNTESKTDKQHERRFGYPN
jgi:hypothetical protein